MSDIDPIWSLLHLINFIDTIYYVDLNGESYKSVSMVTCSNCGNVILGAVKEGKMHILSPALISGSSEMLMPSAFTLYSQKNIWFKFFRIIGSKYKSVDLGGN